MENYWESNFKALSAKKPDLAAALKDVQIPDHYKIEEAKDGSPALVSEEGKRHFISSAYNPQKQAKNILRPYRFEDRGDVILFGDSLGYLSQEIFKELNFRHRFFIVIHDKSLLKIMMTYNNMSSLIYADNVRWLMGEEYKDVLFLAFEQRPPEYLLTIRNNVVEEMDQRFYDDLSNLIQKALSTKLCEFYTLYKVGKTFRENLIKNIRFISKHPHVQELNGLLKGRPAVMIAAGPSLDKNIHVLKENQNKVFIICVSTVLKKVLDYGILPDIVATFDMGQASCRYLEGVETDIPLVVDLEAHHKILPKYNGPVFLWPPNKPVTKWISKFSKDFTIMQKGSSVSHLIFFVAELLECSPLIMVGMDLAFTDNKTHADGANAAWGGQEDLEKANIQMKAWDGKSKVNTFSGFLTFIALFEQKIRAYNGKVVDATEGGAFKEGTENITLQEAIDTYCSEKFDVKNDLQNLYKNAPRLNNNVLKEQIKLLIDQINEMQKKCDSSRDKAHSLIKAAKNNRDIKSINKSTIDAEKEHLDLLNYPDSNAIAQMALIKLRLIFITFFIDDYKGHDKYLELGKLYKYNAVILKEDLKEVKDMMNSILNQI